MGIGLACGPNSVCQTEPKTEAASVCPNRTDIEGKPKTIFFLFFSRPRGMSMEEDAEMGEDSTSRVSMRAAGGTFIAGTADAPVDTAAEPAGAPGKQKASLLGNPSHVLPCRTFVLSSRSSGCC